MIPAGAEEAMNAMARMKGQRMSSGRHVSAAPITAGWY